MAELEQPRRVTGWAAKLAAYWLVAVAAFSLGIYLYDQQLWPYGTIQDVRSFLEGSPDEELGVAAKIRNDLGLEPDRHLVVPREAFEHKGPYEALEGLPLKGERQAPMVYLSPDAPAGYRLIHGTFAFENTLHGVILLGPDGRLERFWEITQ
jgi:hypothetical protein